MSPLIVDSDDDDDSDDEDDDEEDEDDDEPSEGVPIEQYRAWLGKALPLNYVTHLKKYKVRFLFGIHSCLESH